MLETWVKAHPGLAIRANGLTLDSSPQIYLQHALRLARFLLLLGVGLLLPFPGTAVLLVGETILIIRLLLLDQESASSPQIPFRSAGSSWGLAFRAAASKWGLATSMIVFAWTLQDRIAEIGAACSVVLWLALNFPARIRSQSRSLP